MRPFPGARSTALDLMRERDFRIIWSVGILGEFGRRYEILVLSLLILDITDSPAQLMLLWVFNNLPRPFVSALAGYIADRFPRQRVMLLMQAVNVLSVAGLFALMLEGLDLVQPWHLLCHGFRPGNDQGHRRPLAPDGYF